MNLFYLLLTVVIIVLSYITVHDNTVHGVNNINAYGEKKDSVNVLLDRIVWASNYSGRVSITIRYLLYSIMIVIFVGIIMLNRLPKPIIYIQGVFICWFILISFDSYITHHNDKYHDYAIIRNVKLLRKKLGIKDKYKKPKKFTKRFTTISRVMNYVYDKE